MPVISIGTWTEGTKEGDKNVSAIVGSWLDLGAKGIDTAWVYFTQKEISEVLANRGVDRKDLFITSKIPTCLGAAATRYFVDYDLKKLNTSYLDLLLIHFPGIPGPLGGCDETWEVLEDYHSKGVLRAIGVSNWGVKQLKSLKAKVPPAVNQIMFNIFSHDDDTVAYCREHKITIEAFSPLGDPERTHKSVFSDPHVIAIAAKHNVSAGQVAMRWIVQKGYVLTFLSSSKEHQANDADLFSFELDADDISKLDRLKDETAKGDILV